MRAKILAAGFICLMGAYCARAPQGQTVGRSERSITATVLAKDSVVYDNITPDNLLAKFTETLADMKISEYRTNTAARRIMAVLPETIAFYEFPEYTVREPGKQDEVIRKKESTQTTLYLLLTAEGSKGGSVLTAIVSGDRSAAARGKAVLKRFLELLDKNIKK